MTKFHILLFIFSLNANFYSCCRLHLWLIRHADREMFRRVGIDKFSMYFSNSATKPSYPSRCCQLIKDNKQSVKELQELRERSGRLSTQEGYRRSLNHDGQCKRLLAQRIVQGDVPEPLFNRKLISLDMGSLVAGAKFRGDFEEHGTMDARNLLKPMLGQGELRLFCGQPFVEDTISILHGYFIMVLKYQMVHLFQQLFLQTGTSLDVFCQTAIYLVDEAAAKLKMEITSKPTELDEMDRAMLKLEMEKLSLKNDTDKASKERVSLEMEAAKREYELSHAPKLKYGTWISLQHQLEEAEKNLSEKDKLVMLEEVLHKRVIGQDIAVKSVADAPDISLTQKIALVRIDISENIKKHAISCLVGPCQVMLLMKKSGILFDEIEKEHHDDFNILLQLIHRQVIELARQNFRLEFMNQIDEYIVFQPLDSKEIIKLSRCRQILSRLQERLKQRKIDLHYTNEVAELLGMLGSNSNFGTRLNEIAMGKLRGNFKKYGHLPYQTSSFLLCICSSGYRYLHDI
ncbi:hypothetical protein UlMin_043947 [Ulmus minor]